MDDMGSKQERYSIDVDDADARPHWPSPVGVDPPPPLPADAIDITKLSPVEKRRLWYWLVAEFPILAIHLKEGSAVADGFIGQARIHFKVDISSRIDEIEAELAAKRLTDDTQDAT